MVRRNRKEKIMQPFSAVFDVKKEVVWIPRGTNSIKGSGWATTSQDAWMCENAVQKMDVSL